MTHQDDQIHASGFSVQIHRALLLNTDAQEGTKQRSPFNLPETARSPFLSRVREENDRLRNQKGNSRLRVVPLALGLERSAPAAAKGRELAACTPVTVLPRKSGRRSTR